MRLKETTGTQETHAERLLWTHETQRDYWRLMRLRETTGDS